MFLAVILLLYIRMINIILGIDILSLSQSLYHLIKPTVLYMAIILCHLSFVPADLFAAMW